MDDNVLVESVAKEKKSGCAIASLVLGIISLVTLCTTGSVLGLAGIILAIIALAVRKEPKRGMAIGGLITSIIGFVVGVILIVAVVLSMNMVKTTLLERGMTEEQIEVLGEIFTPQQIADYSKLYLDYSNGDLKPGDLSLEKLGLEDKEFTEDEVDALKALAQSMGVDESVLKDVNKDNIKEKIEQLDKSLLTQP